MFVLCGRIAEGFGMEVDGCGYQDGAAGACARRPQRGGGQGHNRGVRTGPRRERTLSGIHLTVLSRDKICSSNLLSSFRPLTVTGRELDRFFGNSQL